MESHLLKLEKIVYCNIAFVDCQEGTMSAENLKYIGEVLIDLFATIVIVRN